jgi:hypothetical protein
MQYLKNKSSECAAVHTNKNKPYCMQSMTQYRLARPTADKILHRLQLIFNASFEPARVMENITVMISEDDLILDVVFTTLRKAGPSRLADIKNNKHAQPLV